MDFANIDKLRDVTGFTLNPEERCFLEAAIHERKTKEKLSGKLLFWGKLFANAQDYLIIVNVDSTSAFLSKTFYFCTTNDYSLRVLPIVPKEFVEEATSLRTILTGDPSYFNQPNDDSSAEREGGDVNCAEDSGSICEVDDEQKKQAENAAVIENDRFREIHRLSYIVQKIDHDCFIVPCGALAINIKKQIVFNSQYQGLNFDTAQKLCGYCHFRIPESAKAKLLLKQSGLVTSTEFLDSIEKDSPKELWSLSMDEYASEARLRHQYWQGYGFFAAISEDGVASASNYGGAYFGNGIPNHDFIFML